MNLTKTKSALNIMHGLILSGHAHNSQSRAALKEAKQEIEDLEKPLLQLVEEYLEASGMGESYFGAAVCKNSMLVKRLRAGKTVKTETEQTIRDYIAENKES